LDYNFGKGQGSPTTVMPEEGEEEEERRRRTLSFEKYGIHLRHMDYGSQGFAKRKRHTRNNPT
jgi:hypothetical protein